MSLALPLSFSMGKRLSSGDLRDDDETLSLRDLPVNADEDDANFDDVPRQSRRSSSEPPDLFQFFDNMGYEMCAAEDIMFCGKLLPLKPLSEPPIPALESVPGKLSTAPSSLTRSNSTKTPTLFTRNTRSLDYRKLTRCSRSVGSPSPEMERNSSVKSIGKSDASSKRTVKPRWYTLLMFGMAKFPAEMELNDIRNRQYRRSPSAMFDPPPNRGSGKVSSRLLKALSCKDPASVAVTAAPFYVPHL